MTVSAVMHHNLTLTCLDSIEYLSGSKVSAPGLRLVSVRFEDLVQDLELEVGEILRFLDILYCSINL